MTTLWSVFSKYKLAKLATIDQYKSQDTLDEGTPQLVVPSLIIPGGTAALHKFLTEERAQGSSILSLSPGLWSA